MVCISVTSIPVTWLQIANQLPLLLQNSYLLSLFSFSMVCLRVLSLSSIFLFSTSNFSALVSFFNVLSIMIKFWTFGSFRGLRVSQGQGFVHLHWLHKVGINFHVFEYVEMILKLIQFNSLLLHSDWHYLIVLVGHSCGSYCRHTICQWVCCFVHKNTQGNRQGYPWKKRNYAMKVKCFKKVECFRA